MNGSRLCTGGERNSGSPPGCSPDLTVSAKELSRINNIGTADPEQNILELYSLGPVASQTHTQQLQ
jgi:hypothetical protein